QIILKQIYPFQGYVCTMYEFRFDTFSQINGDTETLIEFNMRLLGRERLLNGTIKFHEDIDDEFMWKIFILQHINGDWKPLPVKLQNTTCPFLEYFYGKYWANSVADTNLPRGCPIRKGEYYLMNMTMSSDLLVTLGKQGLNRCQVIITKNNISYGGFSSDAMLKDIP
ncbi:hypothetical protein KR032_002775, partial [Drosophila birchii]